jgi:hypothetical protein
MTSHLLGKLDKFLISGKEFGGLTIKGHVSEKDGILACFFDGGSHCDEQEIHSWST